MFDTAHVGDTALYCGRTFGLRPAEAWGEPVTVTAVEQTYWGPNVTVSDGTVLSHDLHHLSIIRCDSPDAEAAHMARALAPLLAAREDAAKAEVVERMEALAAEWERTANDSLPHYGCLDMRRHLAGQLRAALAGTGAREGDET